MIGLGIVVEGGGGLHCLLVFVGWVVFHVNFFFCWHCIHHWFLYLVV